MADLIIKGMEMPKNCIDCMFTTIDYDMCILAKNDLILCGGRPSWCPLVPLPEKHGDLIDRDALGEFPYNISFCDEGDIEKWIADAPIIVPAEGGTGDVRCL